MYVYNNVNDKILYKFKFNIKSGVLDLAHVTCIFGRLAHRK